MILASTKYLLAAVPVLHLVSQVVSRGYFQWWQHRLHGLDLLGLLLPAILYISSRLAARRAPDFPLETQTARKEQGFFLACTVVTAGFFVLSLFAVGPI